MINLVIINIISNTIYSVNNAKKGRTFQLTASGLSSLKVVATTTTKPVIPSSSSSIDTNEQSTTTSGRHDHAKPPDKPKLKSTSSQQQQESFQSPRKLKTINILRRRRASVSSLNCNLCDFTKMQERNKVYETPTRSSRRKQVFWETLPFPNPPSPFSLPKTNTSSV